MESDELSRLIDAATAQPTRVRRLLEVAGIITEVVIPHRVVIVGGLAVAYWTSQQEATDIDVAMPDTRELREVFERLGFEKGPGERHWELSRASVGLEAPAAKVADYETVLEAESPTGRPLNLLSPADLFVWRLDEFVGTGHTDAAAHMVALARSSHYDRPQATLHAGHKGLVPALPLVDAIIDRWEESGPLAADELHECSRIMLGRCYRRE